MARLKDEKRRTLSSRTWLERQLSDPYVARAKSEGFRSRAAYKLAEIDDKYHVLKPGARVVDLGAAPGGWSEIAAKRIGGTGPRDRARHSRHEADRGGRISQARFSRCVGAGSPQGHARRQCGRRALRHGGQCHRPPPDRPFTHHGACRGRDHSSPAKCSPMAACFSARSCKAARKQSSLPNSSAISKASSTSSRRRAAPIPRSSICSRAGFGITAGRPRRFLASNLWRHRLFRRPCAPKARSRRRAEAA